MDSEHTGSLILIVDDELTNLSVLVDTLSHAGLNVSVAKSGEDALEHVNEISPDLILLDVIMPGIDGFETCRRLKDSEAATDIPVIFITALTEAASIVTGFEVGGVDYITKPFRHEEVLARVNAHLTIREQRRQLQALNASKNTFFSIIAHDLKNPFTGFLSLVHLLKQSVAVWDKDGITKFTALLETSTGHLSALLENLLTWSQIQRGIIDYYAEQFDLHLLAVRNIKLFTSTAEQKQISLSSSIPKQTLVYADVNMVDTVMRNLLSNALKFTPVGGTVELSARCNQQSVEISVADTGIGIAQKHLPGLFRIDVKYKRRGTAHEQGSGLGLILCKEFVERNNGRIWVESEVEKGSRFTVALPRKKVDISG